MRFTRGDHLRVRRWPIGYFHHGIYVSDEQVIQFGGRISDKPRANIEVVFLVDFERNGTAEVVPHGGHTWFGAWRPDAEPVEKIVQKAEWLYDNHPKGLYDVMGYNCEHAANFCVTGWPESYQVRGYLFVHAVAEGLLAPFLITRLRLSPRLALTLGVFSLVGLTAVHYSWFISKRFWERIGLKWRAYERSVSGGGSPFAKGVIQR